MPDKKYLLYVARHGTTVLNATDCFRGPRNPPLDEQGHRDAKVLAKFFRDKEISHIFASDKLRSKQTAEAISKEIPEAPLHYNEGLRAWNLGYLGGQPKNEENVEVVRQHVNNPDLPIRDGESLNDFRGRVRPILGEAIKLALRLDEPVLIVAHSSIVHELGEVLSGDHKQTLVLPGGVAAVYISGGRLRAEPIFKADEEAINSPKDRPDIVT